MSRKKPSKKSRHITNRHGENPTYSVPTVSLGKKDRELLIYLFENQNERFNVREYAERVKKMPRSSVYEILNRLENKGFVERNLGNNKINEKGRIYLDATNFKQKNVSNRMSVGGVGNKTNLSSHYHKFKLPISSKKNFSINSLQRMHPIEVKENRLVNLHQIIAVFNDAKIVVNPKQVIINLFELIGNDVEDSDIRSLSRAVEYAEKLKKIGLLTEGVMLEEGHWARMESVLSDFLYDKVDKRYFLTLHDGSRFWIDHSQGKREDETDSKLVRERIDNFLGQVTSKDFDLNDIDKIKESLGIITKLEGVRLMDSIEKNRLKQKELEIEKTPRDNIVYKGYIS